MKMENVYLGRKEAPIGADTWQLLDSIMIEAAKSQLRRRLITLEGPYGYGLKVLPLSDCELEEGISTSSVVPVHAIKSGFSLGKRDLAAFEKEKLAFDGGPVACAAMDCAAKEDGIIFQGISGSPGLLNIEGASTQTLTKWDKVGAAADQIIEAVTKLDDAGLHGGYCMALAPSLYNLLLRRYPQGDGTELDHIRYYRIGRCCQSPGPEKGRSPSRFRSPVLFALYRTGYGCRLYWSGRRQSGILCSGESGTPHPCTGSNLCSQIMVRRPAGELR